MNFMMLNHNHATMHHVYKSGPLAIWALLIILSLSLLNFWKVCLKTHLSDSGSNGNGWTKHALLAGVLYTRDMCNICKHTQLVLF